jgi:hypothetical protein
MIQHHFDCPHCWEKQLKLIDSSINDQSFIEDCEVCCNPNKIDYLFKKNQLIHLDISDGNE